MRYRPNGRKEQIREGSGQRGDHIPQWRSTLAHDIRTLPRHAEALDTDPQQPGGGEVRSFVQCDYD
jgi:hypothetical protein